MQGRERVGPTAALLSATKWDHPSHLGGIAVNLKFTCAHDGAFAPKLVALVSTYTVFLKGCPFDCFWCHKPEAQRSQIEPVTS